MAVSKEPDSIRRFISAIQELPSDEPVADRQTGYNNYNTQKDHWLGWLGVKPGQGIYARKTGKNRDAKYVYSHIVEPKMLLWLVEAARVKPELIAAAKRASSEARTLPGKAAAIRKRVPWSEVWRALWGGDGSGV